ncbi:MAG: CoA-binding protein [Candidatus Thorarchaeota archaeon]|nr:CoA-binding protein [Candidatus Thorarchaeota archaeon]
MSEPARPTIAQMLDIKSVAIVGVSPNMGYYWAHSMLQWQHDLRVWLVSRNGGEVLGHRILVSVEEIPEPIDYAIIAVPNKYVPPVLEQCAKKGARGATVFSSGYSELGTEEGRARERELGAVSRKYGIRILGPNCMGLCYPRLGFAFMPTVKRLAGNVGFLSQSGGVAIAVYTAGVESGMGFSKLFSFGNQLDITPPEIMEYFREDPETHVIGAYIEGTKDGVWFLRSMTQLAAKKPAVVLKGGRSEEGSRAASSHTGALAGASDIWSAAFRQANVPVVTTLEDMVATLSVFSMCPPPRSRNVGMIAISGGTSVIYTDLCIEHGLRVPKTSEETIRQLRPLIKDVGTGLSNPIDLAADYYQDQTTREVIRIVGNEPGFDSIIVEADVHNIHQVATIMGANDIIDGFWKTLARESKRVMQEHHKPVLIAVPEIAYPAQRAEAWSIFVEAGVPVFRNIREAVGALTRVCDYYETKGRRHSQS